MWTAKINKKEESSGLQRVYVDFTNGEKTVTEWCIPSDEAGFKHWVKSRISAFETASAMEALIDGQEIDLTETTSEPSELTQEEIDRNTWLEKWNEYKAAKKGMDELTDAGIIPTDEEQAAFETLKQWVADNRKMEYTHLI